MIEILHSKIKNILTFHKNKNSQTPLNKGFASNDLVTRTGLEIWMSFYTLWHIIIKVFIYGLLCTRYIASFI